MMTGLLRLVDVAEDDEVDGGIGRLVKWLGAESAIATGDGGKRD